jgi:hypothetical protein
MILQLRDSFVAQRHVLCHRGRPGTERELREFATKNSLIGGEDLHTCSLVLGIVLLPGLRENTQLGQVPILPRLSPRWSVHWQLQQILLPNDSLLLRHGGDIRQERLLENAGGLLLHRLEELLLSESLRVCAQTPVLEV